MAPEPAQCPFPGCDTVPRFKPLILGRLCNSSFRLRTDYARFKGIWRSGCTGRAQSTSPTSPARAPAGNSCSWCLATCSELLLQLKFNVISTFHPRGAAPGSTSGKNETCCSSLQKNQAWIRVSPWHCLGEPQVMPTHTGSCKPGAVLSTL